MNEELKPIKKMLSVLLEAYKVQHYAPNSVSFCTRSTLDQIDFLVNVLMLEDQIQSELFKHSCYLSFMMHELFELKHQAVINKWNEHRIRAELGLILNITQEQNDADNKIYSSLLIIIQLKF